MIAFNAKFSLLLFLSLLSFPIFSGDRPTLAQLALQSASAAAYSAQKDVNTARRKLAFETRKFQAELHKKASAHAYQKAYQTPSTSSMIQPAVYAQEYDEFLYRNPLKDHVAWWKNNNIPFLESKRYLAYCKYALLTAKANQILEFEPPYKPILIPDYNPIPTLT